MNKRVLFSIALRFISLLLLLACFQNIVLFALESTIPTARQMSLFGLSPVGNPARIISIILYALTGYFVFKKSDYISLKLIKNNTGTSVSRETVLQIVVAYQAIAGIIDSVMNIINVILNILPFFLTIEDASSAPSLILQKTGIYLIGLIISILLLRYYEKVTRFLLTIIPTKFWAK